MMRPLRPLLLSAVLVLAACGQKSGVADESGDSGGGDAGSGGAPATTAAAPTTAPGDTTVPGDTTPAGDTTAPTTAAPAHEAGPNDTAGRHRRRDRHRHPRPGHRRVADPADDLRHRQGHLLEVPGRERPRSARSAGRSGSCSATTSSTRTGPVQVCREMVEKENAFVLVGGGGADQITACAKYADEAGVPYFSAGVNEEGLDRPLDLLRRVADLRRSRSPLLIDLIEELGVDEGRAPS